MIFAVLASSRNKGAQPAQPWTAQSVAGSHAGVEWTHRTGHEADASGVVELQVVLSK
jgi:hypothetical protein